MSNIGNNFGAQDFKAVTRAMDLNRNGVLDPQEATFTRRADRVVGNGNGINGTRETSDALKRGDLFVRGMKPQAADALATYFSKRELNEGKMPQEWRGDDTISRDDLNLSPAALRTADRNGDGRVSRGEFSAALVSGSLSIGIDSVVDDRPTPPPVDRPVPPPIERPVPPPVRSRALDTMELAVGLAGQGYTNRANEAFSAAISQTVSSDEALTIGRRAASLGYTNRGNDAFSRAASLANSPEEAHGIARATASLGYTNRANEAYQSAIGLTRHSSEAVAIARSAASNGYTNRANDAFSRAVSLANYAGEALDIARVAAPLGYTNRANEAYGRAISLSQTRPEASEIARDAMSRGYTNKANEASQRAIYLP